MSSNVWVVVADAARARIFTADTTLEEFEMVETLHHPDSRKKESELVSDTHAPHARRGARSGPAQHGSHHEHELEVFAKEVAQHLEGAHAAGTYGSLVLVSPARFLGVLRQELPKGAASAVEATLSKDYSRMPSEQIRVQVAAALADRPLVS